MRVSRPVYTTSPSTNPVFFSMQPRSSISFMVTGTIRSAAPAKAAACPAGGCAVVAPLESIQLIEVQGMTQMLGREACLHSDAASHSPSSATNLKRPWKWCRFALGSSHCSWPRVAIACRGRHSRLATIHFAELSPGQAKSSSMCTRLQLAVRLMLLASVCRSVWQGCAEAALPVSCCCLAYLLLGLGCTLLQVHRAPDFEVRLAIQVGGLDEADLQWKPQGMPTTAEKVMTGGSAKDADTRCSQEPAI